MISIHLIDATLQSRGGVGGGGYQINMRFFFKTQSAICIMLSLVGCLILFFLAVYQTKIRAC